MKTTRNETTFETVYNRGLKKTDIKFSEYLACIEDIDFIKKYLSRKQDTYTKQEDQFLVNRNVNIIAALSIMINNVYSKNLALKIMMNAYSILETNLVEVNNTIHYRRLQIKEMRDSAINYIYARIMIRIYFRNKQIQRQKQYFESLLF
ncbi:uncharacterized protein LOC114928862 isoform X2 [Nylanderia fulva]|uniref:uncharacterized protein LOC114928862 isoform X2 n=1 Tax=Nylanderia fulva TaxID=613905 RepID=UPI0010FB5A6D|nr:uncharacterized protein LOC114928862 isoform X2 [Nylanderia fulva]